MIGPCKSSPTQREINQGLRINPIRKGYHIRATPATSRLLQRENSKTSRGIQARGWSDSPFSCFAILTIEGVYSCDGLSTCDLLNGFARPTSSKKLHRSDPLTGPWPDNITGLLGLKSRSSAVPLQPNWLEVSFST